MPWDPCRPLQQAEQLGQNPTGRTLEDVVGMVCQRRAIGIDFHHRCAVLQRLEWKSGGRMYERRGADGEK